MVEQGAQSYQWGDGLLLIKDTPLSKLPRGLVHVVYPLVVTTGPDEQYLAYLRARLGRRAVTGQVEEALARLRESPARMVAEIDGDELGDAVMVRTNHPTTGQTISLTMGMATLLSQGLSDVRAEQFFLDIPGGAPLAAEWRYLTPQERPGKRKRNRTNNPKAHRRTYL